MFNANRKFCVRQKRTAVIGVFIQQNRLPKAVHFFQMCRPTVLNYIIENIFQLFVISYFIVETIHHLFNIIKI